MHTPVASQPATEDYSLIYMAPEYVKDMNCDTLHSLSTKGDVFAFAKVGSGAGALSQVESKLAGRLHAGWNMHFCRVSDSMQFFCVLVLTLVLAA